MAKVTKRELEALDPDPYAMFGGETGSSRSAVVANPATAYTWLVIQRGDQVIWEGRPEEGQEISLGPDLGAIKITGTGGQGLRHVWLVEDTPVDR